MVRGPPDVPHSADARQERIRMTLLRIEIGDALRTARRRQGRTLREVSSDARVSLGYLSEIERGQKEASSELLASICGALEMPVSILLRDVSDRFALDEGVAIPDTVPVELSRRVLSEDTLADGPAMAGRV
ncbi:helix-turn-helix domain-containing protein [Brevibacterium yomogidense]|uniref:helix-turn-helix domain-containing protein n=2 Tax=Brevibacterium yomogidense TaxID=946573 RepID=UPI003CD057D6